jgi:hypothetical protein
MSADLECTEVVYWVHVQRATTGVVCGSFETACGVARRAQRPLDWGGSTREFVALRHSAAVPGRGGVDRELMRWEVFPERVAVLVPTGQGGLTEEQRDRVLG